MASSPVAPLAPTRPGLDGLRDALLRWYAAARRDLPWRRTTDPYAILVSEVMLQQTQVARVVPRYVEWLGRWPSVDALAAAPVADVLRAWVGLGYNRRALAVHATARIVARDGWPADLRTLPGVGPYTAAAVASFAFGAQVAAVDTNVRRVAERLGRGTPAELLPPGRAAEFNQAAMELGATVCTARAPRCGECPVAGWCAVGGGRSAVRGASAGALQAREARSSVRDIAADGASREGAPAGGGARGGRSWVPGRASRRGSSAGGVAAAPRERFEDTNRWVRGRVVAALAAGEALPADIAAERLERALAGLERDGLVRRVEGGFSLP